MIKLKKDTIEYNEQIAFIVCRDNVIDFVIPEINLRGSEPTENINDVISLLTNRYSVTEYEVI